MQGKLGSAQNSHYFSLDNAQLAVRRRFTRRRANFFALYAPLADDWALLDKSHAGQARLTAEFSQQQLQVKDAATWKRINPEAHAPKA